MTDSTQLASIGQIALNVHDFDRAVAFYRDTLGLKLLFTAGCLAFFDCDGVRLMLTLPEKPEFDHPNSLLYFRTADIGASHQVLSTRGVRFVDQPRLIVRMPDHELWMTFFRDPEENLLALMSEVRHAA